MSSIGNILNQPTEPPKKKRGRPSNAEKAARREQEITRGQLIPPQTREPPIASGSGSSTAGPGTLSIATYAAQAAMTPHPRDQPLSAGASDTSSGRKKRGGPPNAEKEARRTRDEHARSESQTLELARPDTGTGTGPSHGLGPSRYPNILSSEEVPGRRGPMYPGDSPSRGDPMAYR